MLISWQEPQRKDLVFTMKKTSKILSVFLALVMVISCIPMSAFAQERDTSSLDAYVDTDNLAIVVEDLLTALNDRKEEIVPSVLNICFQLIDDLKEQAEADGVDLADAETEELASSLLAYLDVVLEDANLNGEIKDFKSIIGMVLGGVDIDLNSVNGVINTLVAALDYLAKQGTGFCGDIAKFDTSDLKVGKGKKAEAMSTKNASSLQIVYGLFGFISNEDNVSIIKKVVGGKLDLGSVNGIVEMAGINLEEEVNGLMGNLDVTINELLYDNLLAEKETVTNEDGSTSEVIKVAYADSIYKDYNCDELLAAALVKLITGEDVDRKTAGEVAQMTLSELLGKYGDYVIASFALEPLNNDLKTMLNDLVNENADLAILKDIINLDYEFEVADFNFTALAKDGIFEGLNDLVCGIIEELVQPSVAKELALKTGGNENITANLTSFFSYVLKTLSTYNGGKLEFAIDGKTYSYDFSSFTADKLAGMNLEAMLLEVVNLLVPSLLGVEVPKDIDSLENLALYAAYYAIDMYMVKPEECAFTTDYKDLVFNADGTVRDISYEQWVEAIGTMGMEVADYWLGRAGIGYEASQADNWEGIFEDIIDWALGYIKGFPAVADELDIEIGTADGYGPWYKLNVVINEMFALNFVNGCGDETFVVDTYTLFVEKLGPSLLDCDLAEFADVLATNEDPASLFNQSVIAGVLGLVDNLLFSIFEHECGETATFTKVATATHDGYEGTYCVANGHYVDVEVLPATGETTTQKPDETTTQKPDETTTEPPVSGDLMKGDVNGNGKVDPMDARLALRAASKLEKLEGDKFTVADVNGNGKIDPMDARTILRVASKLEKF